MVILKFSVIQAAVADPIIKSMCPGQPSLTRKIIIKKGTHSSKSTEWKKPKRQWASAAIFYSDPLGMNNSYSFVSVG